VLLNKYRLQKEIPDPQNAMILVVTSQHPQFWGFYPRYPSQVSTYNDKAYDETKWNGIHELTLQNEFP